MTRTRITRSDLQRGIVATFATGGAMALAKVALAAPLPPEMAFNYVGRLLGVPAVFNLVHQLPWGLDRYAKFALFGGVLIVFALLGILVGAYYRRVRQATGWPLAALLYAAALPLLVGLVLLPIQGLGWFGTGRGNFLYPPLATHLWALGFGGVLALALELSMRRRRPSDAPRRTTRTPGTATSNGHDPVRRAALLRLGRLGLVAFAGTALVRLAAGARALAQELRARVEDIVGVVPQVTPTEDHYVVSKNVFNPSVPERSWSLSIVGRVRNPITLTLADLQALPAVTRTSTLTCISNEVGGDLIGNSEWTGVRLADLLETAGVEPGANELILRAADNYADSFPLDAALREGTIVAYLQNGEPLTRDHGFPARVLVPGIYGMKNVKWVVEIELTDDDFLGYWQTRGWSDSALIQTMSRIDTPTATVLDDGSAMIGGVAYGGLRGIEAVEVSLDGGATWDLATIEPALNDLSWIRWGYRWDAAPGRYQAVVRATDGTGTTQTAERNRPLPDGATGYHQVEVRVP